MKITNNGIPNASPKANESVQGITSGTREGNSDSIMQDMDLYIPSQEWLRIQSLLRQLPEVRGDRVALAGERLASGYYLTPASVQQTAAAMASSLD